MKVLVVGGAGYIGSHMTRLLLNSDYEVVVVDDLSTGHQKAIDARAVFRKANISDMAALNSIFEEYQIDAVMHFAARSIVAHSISNPIDYYKNNVAAPLNLLECMHDYGVDKFIFSSTAAVYGEPQTAIIDENHRIGPINPYGRSKAMTEQVIMDCCAAYQLKAVVLRYFNAAGADPSGEIGEAHEPETHLIPRLCRLAFGENLPVTIYGDDYDTLDGTCVRDYVHVNDLAAAHVRALEYLHNNEGFAVFNLGCGNGFSVKQVVEATERVTGVRLNLPTVARRQGDPSRLVASDQRAKAVLGWNRNMGSIDDIIQTAWNWHRRRAY